MMNVKKTTTVALLIGVATASCAGCGSTARSAAGTADMTRTAAVTSPATPGSAVGEDPALLATQEVNLVGRSYPDTFAGAKYDQPGERVLLYATDTSQAQKLVADARKAKPAIADVVVTITKVQYTKDAEDNQMHRLMDESLAKPFAYPIYSTTANFGQGLLVTVPFEAAKSDSFQAQVRSFVAPMQVEFQGSDPPGDLVLHKN